MIFYFLIGGIIGGIIIGILVKYFNRILQEEKRKEKERREKLKEQIRKQVDEAIRQFLILSSTSIPINEFKLLGLSIETATEEDVKKNFRSLCFKKHSDHNGGKTYDLDLFVKAKDKCIKYLKTKKTI